jgi:phosphoketolase
MSKLDQFKEFVASLDPKDVRKLTEWMDAYNAELWDQQIEADAEAGKFDDLAARARANHKAGKTSVL